jgi:hypothetical protein
MFVRLQSYKITDHSIQMANHVRPGIVVEMKQEGQSEVVCVGAINAGIGVMNSAGKKYFVSRGGVLQPGRDGDE